MSKATPVSPAPNTEGCTGYAKDKFNDVYGKSHDARGDGRRVNEVSVLVGFCRTMLMENLFQTDWAQKTIRGAEGGMLGDGGSGFCGFIFSKT